MKIEMRARVVFFFEITRKDLDALKRAAKVHYDGACQRTIARVGAPIYPGSKGIVQENGILTIWGDELDFDNQDKPLNREPPEDKAEDKAEVSCTVDEADLLAKVTERWMVMQFGDDEKVIEKWHSTFIRMIELSNRAYNEWRKEMEI